MGRASAAALQGTSEVFQPVVFAPTMLLLLSLSWEFLEAAVPVSIVLQKTRVLAAENTHESLKLGSH